MNKKALFDIGAAGPLAGFIVAVPCVLIGMKLSIVGAATPNALRLGDPLLFKLLQWLVVKPPPGQEVFLHPIGYAGWVGLFVTALNLMPVGQLDGGHIIYAVFGEKSRWAYGLSIAMLAGLALLYNPGWLVLIVLLLIFGMRHPRPFDEQTPLDRKRKILAVAMLAIFILSFTPTPFPDLTPQIFGKHGLFR